MSGILIIVCLATLAELHTEEKQEQIKTSGETVLSIEPAKVTALSWEQDGTTLSFHRGDDGWQYDDDVEFPVSDSATAIFQCADHIHISSIPCSSALAAFLFLSKAWV
mgnify:CR=1 FL=1